MRGFLYTYQKFRTEMELPIMVNHEEEKMARLQKMIRPFILRRLK
jgi:SNF2 family DNA or RNA helicase